MAESSPSRYDSSELYKATFANPSELGKPLTLIIRLPVDAETAGEIPIKNSNKNVSSKINAFGLISFVSSFPGYSKSANEVVI
jgi:hypothetical protein